VVCGSFSQTIDPKKVPGSWKPFPASSLHVPYKAPAWLTPAVVKDLGAHLAEVAEVFHRAPFLASPVGWVMIPRSEVYFSRSWVLPSSVDQRWLVAGRLRLWASHFEPDGRTVYDTGSEFGLNFSANDLTCALNNAGAWATDAEGPMLLEVESPTETVHGFPRYQQCVLITHRPGPMFIPVPLERVIKLRIAAVEERVGPFREAIAAAGRSGASVDQSLADLVATHDQVLKDLRAKLAGLTPDQRRGPAFVSPGSPVADVLNFESGRLVVQANPQFFDATRPSDIQLLTIFDDCTHEDGCPSFPVVQRLIAELDWKALSALVR
jgi:hypothetical protein